MSTDPTIEQFREQISDTDRAILGAMNTRLSLVAQIKAFKESHGIAFLDPGREETLLESLARENPGPLSAEGVRELFEKILDLSKRELSR